MSKSKRFLQSNFTQLCCSVAVNALPRPSLSSLCCPLQVKCYHRRAQTADRDTVFRLQFHTCTVHGAQLWFGKSELDEACTGEEEREEEGGSEGEKLMGAHE